MIILISVLSIVISQDMNNKYASFLYTVTNKCVNNVYISWLFNKATGCDHAYDRFKRLVGMRFYAIFMTSYTVKLTGYMQYFYF